MSNTDRLAELYKASRLQEDTFVRMTLEIKIIRAELAEAIGSSYLLQREIRNIQHGASND